MVSTRTTLADLENARKSEAERMTRGQLYDQASELLGQKLLQGWTMLSEVCANCPGVPLVRNRQRQVYCVTCDRFVGDDTPAVVVAPATPAAVAAAPAAAPPIAAPPSAAPAQPQQPLLTEEDLAAAEAEGLHVRRSALYPGRDFDAEARALADALRAEAAAPRRVSTPAAAPSPTPAPAPAPVAASVRARPAPTSSGASPDAVVAEAERACREQLAELTAQLRRCTDPQQIRAVTQAIAGVAEALSALMTVRR